MKLIEKTSPISDEDYLVDRKIVRQMVPFSDRHRDRLEEAGKFPRRIRVGEHRVAWRLSEVRAWQRERIAASEAT